MPLAYRARVRRRWSHLRTFLPVNRERQGLGRVPHRPCPSPRDGRLRFRQRRTSRHEEPCRTTIKPSIRDHRKHFAQLCNPFRARCAQRFAVVRARRACARAARAIERTASASRARTAQRVRMHRRNVLEIMCETRCTRGASALDAPRSTGNRSARRAARWVVALRAREWRRAANREKNSESSRAARRATACRLDPRQAAREHNRGCGASHACSRARTSRRFAMLSRAIFSAPGA